MFCAEYEETALPTVIQQLITNVFSLMHEEYAATKSLLKVLTLAMIRIFPTDTNDC